MNISPNTTGLPGISELQHIVGALLTFGLIAAVAGLVLSAMVWAVASHSGNVHLVGRAKSGVLVSAAAADVDRRGGGVDQFLQPRRGCAVTVPGVLGAIAWAVPVSGMATASTWKSAAGLVGSVTATPPARPAVAFLSARTCGTPISVIGGPETPKGPGPC